MESMYSNAAVMPQEYGEPVSPNWQRLTPDPVVDRFPILLGSNLTLQYLSNTYRLCTQGYRYAFVDVINELLEMDPHSRGVVRQRVLPVAGARLDILPADLPKGDSQLGLAKTIADEVQRQMSALPQRAQSFGSLAWGGTVFGAGACENEWRKGGLGFELKRLNFIHSRRLNVTNPTTWDLHVWDQGLVGGGLGGWPTVTGGTYGLRMVDYPGKFTIHTPQLSGDYLTRNGEARFIGFYMALKRTVVRATAMDFERTIRPWIIGYFNRDPSAKSGDPKFADAKDIASLEAAVRALGLGSLNSAVLSDRCKVDLIRAASNYSPRDFCDFIDEQISKSLLGQTFTTQPGSHGNKSAADVAKDGTREILRYDAQCLADTIERDIVFWIVKLNFPGCEERLCPRVYLNTDEAIEPVELIGLAEAATRMDIPVDANDIAKRVGLKLVDPEDPNAMRTRITAPGKGPTPPDPNDMPPEGQATPQAVKAPAGSPQGARPPTSTRSEDDQVPLEEAAE